MTDTITRDDSRGLIFPEGRSVLDGPTGRGRVRQFRPIAASVPAARRFVCEQIPEDDAAWLVGLLVSELATNAVEHARTDFEVRVVSDDRWLRVEVTDGLSRRPLLRRPRADATGGRGMVIVDQLAGHWGVEPAGTGKVVWFEVPLRKCSAANDRPRRRGS